MKNKKGFTLIELLAVIVILAIIALIATPIILNMIENAKKGAAKDSAYGYIEAIEYNNSIADLGLNNNYTKIPDGEDLDVTSLNIKVKGSKPESGTITIEKGNVTKAELCINNYTVTYDGKTATTGSKCDEKEEAVLKGDPILDKAKSLVYADGACKTDGTTYQYMGGCYIRGANSNNYVWYNGFMWRIMGINNDGTVRLITDENVTAIPYGAANTAETYTSNEDYIHDWLNTYFLGNLNDTKSIIKEGNYFCSQSTNGEALTSETARTICEKESKVEAKVGILSYDEYLLSFSNATYLHISQIFWTMTPYDEVNAWGVYFNHGVTNFLNVIYAEGIRPIINVDPKAKVTKGTGISKDYYVLAEDKTKDKTGAIGENVTSGEYASLEGKTYRVVSKDTDGVKLILNGYYTNTDGDYVKTSFGNSNIFNTNTGIGAILNSEVLNWLNLTDSDKVKAATWNQGIGVAEGHKYTESLGIGDNSVTAKVGLLKIGEMLSAHSSTLVTKDYTKSYLYKNCSVYWLLNKYSNNYRSWGVNDIANVNSVTYDYENAGIRPVIVVRNDLDITGGTGTWNNPYQI